MEVCIFISKNAIKNTMPYINIFWKKKLKNIKWIVIGKGSFKEIKKYNIKKVIYNKKNNVFNSKTLLNSLNIQIFSGKNIVIFKGNDGNSFLYNRLKNKSFVYNFICYKRRLPYINLLCKIISFTNLIIITSSESLKNFFYLIVNNNNHNKQLYKKFIKTNILLTSVNCKKLALFLGFSSIITCMNYDSNLILNSIRSSFCTSRFFIL